MIYLACIPLLLYDDTSIHVVCELVFDQSNVVAVHDVARIQG
jgi:hypothetical protein